MAANWGRATVRSRASDPSVDRRRRGAFLALLTGATLSAATLGSGVFAAAAPAPLATDATPQPAQPDRPDEAVSTLTQLATADEAPPAEQEPQHRKEAEPPAPEKASPEESAAIDEAVRALANDDIPRNAMKAVRALHGFGEKAVPALQLALGSADQQQRHLAAAVLRWLDAAPTPLLCELSIEALGDPEIEGYWRTLIHRPAISAARWLDEKSGSKEVVSHLLVAARSLQPQRRFLAAALLARRGVQTDLHHTCAVLIDQLPDNQRMGDALVAAHGLYRLGAPALPQVRLAYRGADEQARSLLQLVEENLADDAAGRKRTEAELRERYDRLGLRKVTRVRLDPAREHALFGFAVLPRL